MGISGLQSVLSWHFCTVPVLTALELVIAYLFFSRVAQQRLPHWGVLLLALAAFLGCWSPWGSRGWSAMP